MSNTVESTLFVRMEWIRNLIRISNSTAFVSMLSNLLHSHEWSKHSHISTRRNDLSNGLIRPIRLSEFTRYICIHSSQITCIWLVNLRKRLLLLRLPVGRGVVVNSPRFCFFLFVNVESWATAHG